VSPGFASGPRRPEKEGKQMSKLRAWWRAAVVAGLVAALAATVAAVAAAAGNPYKLKSAGTLVVGMNLQYKPQMYLDAKGNPAGYDVVLLKSLAKEMKIKLKIENLDFNGLIPGLVAKKFDMVSVGLSPTPATRAAWNSSDKTITSLQGSTAEQLVAKEFPKAQSKSFPDQNAAFLEVATGRADAIVVENYLLAQFNKSNGNKLKEAAFKKPLHVEYGAWAVQKGNTALVRRLNTFLCKTQKSGKLAKIYKATEGAPLPPMPTC
jgi:ABC-type amino acid transport substrate-binding protein